jgi:hypothetical protein
MLLLLYSRRAYGMLLWNREMLGVIKTSVAVGSFDEQVRLGVIKTSVAEGSFDEQVQFGLVRFTETLHNFKAL